MKLELHAALVGKNITGSVQRKVNMIEWLFPCLIAYKMARGWAYKANVSPDEVAISSIQRVIK